MRKKLVSALLSATMVASLLVGCGNTAAPATEGTQETPATEEAETPEAAATEEAATTAGAGKVYYLNFKPEQDAQWQELAKAYTAETGIPVTVVTAASGEYETTLMSEMEKTDAPTLFQVNGPVGLKNWKDYCYDLKDSELYKHLTSDDFALVDEDGTVNGIAYVIETYGIIYNKAILSDYCTKDYAVIKDASEITSFDKLKEVADSIQKNKDDLGVEGAFTSTGMDSSSDWRFKTHLANLPIYYEYLKENQTSTEAIKGEYLDNYKAIFDLYITDSTCDPKMIASKTGDDATAEFAGGKAVFYQNGTWAYNDISALGDENLGMLPIYIGAEGEDKQGLCTGSENYWCVNNSATEDDIQATLDFVNWVVTSDAGRKSMSQDMGFVTPFDTFTGEYEAQNPLIQAANQYIADGKTSVKWCFTTMPSEEWKNGVGSALTSYAAGGSWDDVVTAFVDGWAAEVEATKE